MEALETARLEGWLAGRGQSAVELVPLEGDVSLRRYWRVRWTMGSAILASYPPALRRAFPAFLTTGELLARSGIQVPRVLEADAAAGLMLLEDLGDATLYTVAADANAILEWYREALALAQRIGDLPSGRVVGLHQPIDESSMRRELDQTWRLFLAPALATTPGLATDLRARLALLCRRLSAAPRAPAHRDFMSRNLIPSETGLVVIDHQDLRLAPLGYDRASLLFDSSRLSRPQREKLIADTAANATFTRVVVQRMLKIVGTFLAFAERGRPVHLGMLPRCVETALENLRALPEGANLDDELAEAMRLAAKRAAREL